MKTISDTIKSIGRIARVELYNLFYSPVAWLLLIVFAFQIGSHMANGMDGSLRIYDLNMNTVGLSDVIVSEWNGIFGKVVGYLYLYIPLLTMGIMSREYSSGSIKLLYSSPVSNLSIIMGKFSAMVVYGLALMIIILANIIYLNIVVENFELSWALIGLLGIFLLFLTYAAIGIFVSSLTQYQVVAAVGTLAILALFTMITTWGGKFPFLSDVTYWLGMNGRVSKFTAGIIPSEDFIYFVSITMLFITLSVLRLNSKRSNKGIKAIAVKYGVLAVVFISVCYLSMLPNLKSYYDGTSNKINTLSLESQEVMKKLNGKLKVTHYVNILGAAGHKGSPTSMIRAKYEYEKFIRFKPDMKVETVAYWDSTFNNSQFMSMHNGKSLEDIAKIMCQNNDYNFNKYLTPEQIRKTKFVRDNDNVFLRVFELETDNKTKTSILRWTRDGNADEANIAAALKLLVEPTPKIGFISTHEGRSIYNTGDLGFFDIAINRYTSGSFVNKGFEVEELDIENNDIKDDINIIILSDLYEPLSEKALNRVKKYIDNGGNIFILGEPKRIDNMNALISYIGVNFEKGLVVGPSAHSLANETSAMATHEGVNLLPILAGSHYQGGRLSLPTASAINYDKATSDFKVTEVFKTENRGYWIDYDSENLNFAVDKPEINPELGEKENALPLVIAMQREVNGKEQRILISSDADCISNSENLRNYYYRKMNDALRVSALRWMTYDKFPSFASYPGRTDNKYKLPQGIRSINKMFTGYAIGTLLIALSLFVIIRRQRK